MTDAFLILAAIGLLAVAFAAVAWTAGPVGVRQLSLRYVRGTGVTVLGVLGIAVAIAVVLVVKSVSAGLIGELDRRIHATSADVQVVAMLDSEGLDRLEQEPGIAAASTTLSPEVGILKLGDHEQMAVKTCQVMGMDLARHGTVSDLADYITFAPGKSVGDLTGNWMVAGRELMQNPEMNFGDEVVLQMVYRSRAGAWERTRPERYTIVGYLETGFYQVDHQTAIVSLATVRRLLGEGGMPRLNIRLAPGADATRTMARLGVARYETYRTQYSNYFQAVDDQGGKLVLMSSIMVAISAVCVFAILVMVTLQRVRDIGILRAIGATRQAVMGAFLGYALMVGLVGSALGVGMAGVAIWRIDLLKTAVMKLTGYNPISKRIFSDEKLPVDWKAPVGNGRIVPLGQDLPFMIVIPGAALGLVVVASVLPAWLASRRDPVEAIHYE